MLSGASMARQIFLPIGCLHVAEQRLTANRRFAMLGRLLALQ
jgi:hypothetical protein